MDLLLRIIGFVGSLILTLAAFALIAYPEYFGAKGTVLAILILAVIQFIVQFVFFLNFWREKSPFWNMGIFISTLSIIFIIIAFSIWIMGHLDYNMMPMMH